MRALYIAHGITNARWFFWLTPHPSLETQINASVIVDLSSLASLSVFVFWEGVNFR